MISKKNLIFHELIGLETKITKATHLGFVGLRGKILDETNSMILLDTDKGLKWIPKLHNRWDFYLEDEIISCSLPNKRPYDRMVK